LTCSKALDIDTNNIKALFRRGQAHSLAGEFDKAKADLTEAAQLSPKSKEIRDELDKLKKNIANYKQQEKKMFAGVFDKMKQSEIKKEEATNTQESKKEQTNKDEPTKEEPKK